MPGANYQLTLSVGANFANFPRSIPQGGRFPSPDEEPVGFTLAQVCLPDGEGQVVEVSVPVLDGDGCQPSLHHAPVRPGPVQFGQRVGIRGAILQGEAVPEGAKVLLLVAGDGAVAHRLGDALPEPLLKGVFNIFVGGAGALGDGRQGLPEDCLR